MLSKLNESVLSIILLTVSAVGMWVALHFGINDFQVIMFIILKVSFYISIGTIFIKFLNGIGFDINKEIFEQHNVAAAIVVGLFWIGLAIAIAAGNLG